MKHVSSQWVVVDHEQNHVGFMRADSLAIVEKIKFSVEGYLLISYGFDYNGKEFIFLSFSSGEILLIDGISLKLLSQMSFENSQNVKSMLAFNQGEYILMASTEGTLFVINGLQNNSIKLVKKLKITDMDHDIRQVSVTSRTNGNQLDLAISTDKGLFFASLAFSTIGRATQFTVKLSEEKFLLERPIAGLVEYEQDKFVVLVQEVN